MHLFHGSASAIIQQQQNTCQSPVVTEASHLILYFHTLVHQWQPHNVISLQLDSAGVPVSEAGLRRLFANCEVTHRWAETVC